MEWIILSLVGISLALDCFAVSACVTSVGHVAKDKYLIVPLHFGVFQLGMTLVGYAIGSAAHAWIERYGPWIAFAILSAIGIKMIVESIKDSKDAVDVSSELSIIMLSVATSIDAFVVGLAFSLDGTPVLMASLLIGVIAFALSLAGLLLGRRIRDLRIGYIGVIGGLVLVAIGIKALF